MTARASPLAHEKALASARIARRKLAWGTAGWVRLEKHYVSGDGVCFRGRNLEGWHTFVWDAVQNDMKYGALRCAQRLTDIYNVRTVSASSSVVAMTAHAVRQIRLTSDVGSLGFRSAKKNGSAKPDAKYSLHL
jgi:hypothetical protein